MHSNEQPWHDYVDLDRLLPAMFKQAGYETYGYGKILHQMGKDFGSRLFDDFYGERHPTGPGEHETADYLIVQNTTTFTPWTKLKYPPGKVTIFLHGSCSS